MNHNLVIYLLIAVVIILFYQVNSLKKQLNKEHATNTCSSADMSAIANLNNLAEEIQKGGLTVPGNLTVKGNITLELPSGSSSTTAGPTINFDRNGKNYFSIYTGSGTSGNQLVLQKNESAAGDISIWNSGLDVDGTVTAKN